MYLLYQLNCQNLTELLQNSVIGQSDNSSSIWNMNGNAYLSLVTSH
jgi:hypothetical protein